MANFSLTEQAERDLEEIVDFTSERWGDLQASKYIDDFYERAKLLSENPEIGLDRTEVKGLLSFPFESHILYYFKDTKGIIITRVLHKNMDPLQHL